MPNLNQFEIGRILGSDRVEKARFGHGQIGALSGAQQYLNFVHFEKSPAARYGRKKVDEKLVEKAFHAVRNLRHDRGSVDLYDADPGRNAEFIAKCRDLGLRDDIYLINKTLFSMRKNNRLKNLDSVKASIDYEDYTFASEYAATELKYEIGVSIDDIVCDPDLALRFDSIARRLTP